MDGSPSGDGRLRVGVVGLGRVSDSHLAGFSSYPRSTITAVCDVNVERVMSVAQEHGATPYAEHQALLDDPNVDAISVLLPHRLHHPVARAALENGKHIAVEKPFTVTEVEA